MRARAGYVLAALVLAAGSAFAGARLGAPEGPVVAQTGGTSGSSGSGSSGNGSSGTSGEGSLGSGQGGGTGDGSSGSGQGSGTDDGSSGSGQGGGTDDGSSGSGSGEGGADDGSSGSGSGEGGTDDGSSGSGSGGGGGGEGDGNGGGGGGGGGTTIPGGGGSATTVPGGTATTAPVAIPQPSTPSSIPASRVREGRPIPCGPGFVVGIRCFDVGDAGDIEGVRVPDGLGGFVIVPIVPVPVANVDTGASTSASSNVDLRVGVNERTGEVVRVERRAPARAQRGFATIAVLLLSVTAAASVATYLRVRRMRGLP